MGAVKTSNVHYMLNFTKFLTFHLSTGAAVGSITDTDPVADQLPCNSGCNLHLSLNFP